MISKKIVDALESVVLQLLSSGASRRLFGSKTVCVVRLISTSMLYSWQVTVTPSEIKVTYILIAISRFIAIVKVVVCNVENYD